VQDVARCVFLKIDVGVNHLPRSPTFILRRQKYEFEVQLLELSNHVEIFIAWSKILADIRYERYASQAMNQGKHVLIARFSVHFS
jgi:hypothetical protein